MHEVDISDGLDVAQTGKFKLELFDNNTGLSCTLSAALKITCGAKFKEEKNYCTPVTDVCAGVCLPGVCVREHHA